jgi:hypothetical protein
MNTRCKPGDLAIITREEPGCESNIGRMVRVSGPMDFDVNLNFEPTWLIYPVTLEPWLFLTSSGKLRFAEFEQGDIEHPDSWMMPINQEDLAELTHETIEVMQ